MTPLLKRYKPRHCWCRWVFVCTNKQCFFSKIRAIYINGLGGGFSPCNLSLTGLDFAMGNDNPLGKLGATITRYNKGPFKCTSACTDAVYSTEWRYYWQVNMPAASDATWMTCIDDCTTPIRYWGDTVAECVINKLCPSHTYVLFKYP